ncbi:MAG: hypothetical protein FJ130_01955 [Deltaproteobacteria bacterium]|nr:hypothetical protein [Deltaproteobacteria bacterium]
MLAQPATPRIATTIARNTRNRCTVEADFGVFDNIMHASSSSSYDHRPIDMGSPLTKDKIRFQLIFGVGPL